MKNKRYRKEKEIIVPLKDEPHIEILGNSQCIVDGLKGVVNYSKEKIVISLGKYCVSFFGDELCIDSFCSQGAIVEGNIISLEFSQYD